MNNNDTYNENDLFLEKMKTEMDKIEVPDELLPENMMKKLSKIEIQQEKKNSKKIITIASVLSMIAMIIVAISICIAYFGIFRGENDGDENTVISGDELMYEADEKGFFKFKSYDKLNKYLIMVEKNNESLNKYPNFILDTNQSFGNSSEPNGAMPDGSVSEDTGIKGDYSDTNERTEGVGEGDVIKTDGKYIYIANDEYVKIVQADGNDTKLVDVLNPLNDIDKWMKDEKYTTAINEIFICDNKLIVIVDANTIIENTMYNEDGELLDSYISIDTYIRRKARTIIRTYDISDLSKISMIGDLAVDGIYDSTRVNDGFLYVFTKKYITSDLDYIPKTNDDNISEDSVYVSKYADYAVYAIMSLVEINNPDKFVDHKAVLHSNGGEYYVSKSNIYLYTQNYDDGYKTEIMKFEYKEGKFTTVASKCLEGSLKDTFCLDEYNGYLRLVVTIINGRHRTNALYVLDNELNIISEIKDIAKDETIYSARFMGDIGYFVTYLQVDPLFSVDLSDPFNPKIIGALKIPGFSEYLHAWGDDKLLGIGRENSYLKLSMFDISNPKDVTEYNKMMLEGMYYSPAEYEYKSVLIDYEKNIIGFAVECENFMDVKEDDYSIDYGIKMKYMIYKFGESGFECITGIDLEYDYGKLHQVRGIYVGQYIYIIEPDSKITILDMDDFSVITKVML